MKTYRLIIILIICGCTSLTFSQVATEDVKEYFWNGKIDYDRNDLLRKKSYQNEMIYLQLKNNSGNISKEFFKINNSTFLYTEYYDENDIELDSYWNIGKKCEGHLAITNKVSGDTITVFDYDTYDHHVFLDTLLLPTGQWKYFHENGKLKYEGKFDRNKRNGKWKFYDDSQNPTKEIEYKYGEIQKVIYQNILLEESIEKTTKSILGNWILRPAYRNNVQNKEAEIDSLNILYKVNNIEGFGDIYSFYSNNECKLTETHIVDTEYKNGDSGLNIIRKYDIINISQGNWKLNSNNELVINIKGDSIKLIIEYISDTKLSILKKEKALNII